MGPKNFQVYLSDSRRKKRFIPKINRRPKNDPDPFFKK